MDVLPLLIADVFECDGALRRHGDRIASVAGQTQARWGVLSVVSEGDWTASSTARRLGVTRQAVQRIVDALVTDGLVVTEPNPRHQRAPLLRLTAAGHDALDAINAASRPWHQEVVAELDADDLATTRRVLRALTARCDVTRPGAPRQTARP